ncbi:MAG: glycine dehydrogenase (aminomethyl-transferring) [Candidatus Omnitrophica bacterium 4484_70.2]|nr:MAG: glycine dehydrogenase (aminomethyl-transferring) [Candidatus Omnitrophica bacterium 4484_70.2]
MRDFPLIFERKKETPTEYIKKPDITIKNPEEFFPPHFLRTQLNLPSLSEPTVVRHFTNLAMRNFSVDTHFYPLGSCTMKYNPKLNEELALQDEFIFLHPYQKEEDFQGILEIIYDLEKLLCEITGLERFSFGVSAGAHAELVGMLIVNAYFKKRGEKREKIIVPDSSHGTNPASASMCGFKVEVVKSRDDGLINIEELKKIVDKNTAAIMLTNPNTLGLFEEEILKIKEIMQKNGALIYYDGANFNALLGITKLSLMGCDIIHLNLHKTFSAPHGSGGPGLGAVGVRKDLVSFLPVPLVDKKNNHYYLNYNLENSIGRVRSFYTNIVPLIKAYSYILRLGKEGLKKVAQISVLNANYIREKLKDIFLVSSPKRCMHEVVFSCKEKKEKGITAQDIAKRLIDYGIHPPTMYFPLIVKEALMIEPTETESKDTLDYFIEVMKKINQEIEETPSILKDAPLLSSTKRVNETQAARNPVLRWERCGV